MCSNKQAFVEYVCITYIMYWSAEQGLDMNREYGLQTKLYWNEGINDS